ncbi:MFS transporter [Acinetobacter zhairhuonensis]|uniref:MFS transporter n=1 Tax=Acinetobacter sp. A7.4 TaxID=2919921 RepID=UPI001F4FA909|nr:MFS transporter [Acinetobacter sp. A7.4]MCJ8162637.1 MFS transporter [Acinetobacter sp. A7.4]
MNEIVTTKSIDESPTSEILSAEIDQIVRKVAWRLIPILFLAYLINFIDRVNISFAKLQMSQALGLNDVAYGIGAGMFFIGYFFFEVPSNMILERIGARRWVPMIMVAWGGATLSLALVTTPIEFYIIRFFIGFAEAGFFPGVVLFMTYWFPASHRGRIMALFMAGLAVSGVIGGPVCGAIIEYLDGYAGLAGWQWLMITTGLPCFIIAAGIYFLLTDRPEQANWLSPREKQVLTDSLGHQDRPKASIKAALLNFWTWSSAWIYFLIVCGGYGISFWMPTLFSQAGIESNAKIGLLVAVPNLLGVIAMLLICRHSDKTQERRWHLTACFTLIAIGYLVIVSQLHSVVGLLIGFSIAHIGILAGAPLSWTIPTRMLTPVAAAVGIGVIASVGNLGGFFAPVLIGKFSALTGSFGIGFLVIGALQLIGALWTALTVRIPHH